MSFLKHSKKLDMVVAGKFQSRFGKMIIGRERETGCLVVLFRSKTNAIIFIRSDQKELEEFK